MLAPPGQPDKRRLMDVKDFFKYTEEAGTPQNTLSIPALHACMLTVSPL